MRTDDFDYELDPGRIAQHPQAKRDNSKLLVLGRKNGDIAHDHFYHLPAYLRPGDLLVVNDTKVIPARLFGSRPGRQESIEVLLLTRVTDAEWECLVRPGKKMRPGQVVEFGEGLLRGEVLEILEDGTRRIRFLYEGIFEEILDQLGEMPLPPYITEKLEDPSRYQTIYAKNDGSAAAPTAGLHFTAELLDRVRQMGVLIGALTLHVGLGTFRPVKVEDVKTHKMHSEYYQLSQELADQIGRTKEAGGRVIAVGTTTTRALESAAQKTGEAVASSGWTDIFIYPGFNFHVIDGLITNFHLPKSTLLMLVSAFSTKENIFRAYGEAIQGDYRFFSFGDAMLIL